MLKVLMPKKITASEYKEGKKLGMHGHNSFPFAVRGRGRPNVGQLLARVAIALAAFSISNLQARSGEISTTCTNPVSGTNWEIRIDYDKSTVDSNPAHISEARIWWHDAKDGGNYTLDRKSGDLTVIIASSTGGAFFYHRCKLLN